MKKLTDYRRREFVNRVFERLLKESETPEQEIERNQAKLKSLFDSQFVDNAEFQKWLAEDPNDRISAVSNAYDALLEKVFSTFTAVDRKIVDFLKISDPKKKVGASGEAFLNTQHGKSMKSIVGRFFPAFKTSFENEQDALRSVFLPMKRGIIALKTNIPKMLKQNANTLRSAGSEEKDPSSGDRKTIEEPKQSANPIKAKYVGGKQKFDQIVTKIPRIKR